MPDFIVRFFHRVRGNIEATIVLSLLGVAMTAFTIVTHGLAWWQQALLIAIFMCVLVWAIYATVSRRVVPTESYAKPLPVEISFPDKIRLFSKELSAYLSNRMARPDQEELYQKYSHPDANLFVQKYNETVQLWDDRLAAGYWLCFAERATALRHELVLRTGADAELDKLLGDLQNKRPEGQHQFWIQGLVERFRLLASRLD